MTKRTIDKHIKLLRAELIDGGAEDVIASRIAYTVECALRWASGELPRLDVVQECRDAARILANELGRDR